MNENIRSMHSEISIAIRHSHCDQSRRVFKVTGLDELGHAVCPNFLSELLSFVTALTNRRLHYNLRSTPMPRKETYSGPISAQTQQDLVSEGIENSELPNGVVMKIAKASVRPLTTRSAEGCSRYGSTVLDTRKCKVAKGNCAFPGEKFNSVYQSLGWVCPICFCC
jgi:hypothetical protein